MLGKLFKYEFKATSRRLLPLYGALMILTIINRLTMPLKILPDTSDIMRVMIGFVKGAFTFLQLASLIGVLAVTLYVIVERFYKNIYSDEGYLTLTLPVSPWKHLLVKLVTSVTWTLVSGGIGVISLLITFYKDTPLQEVLWPWYYDMRDMGIWLELGVNLSPMVRSFGVLLLLSIIAGILHLYLSVSVGQLFSSKHKLLASFVAFLLMNTAVQALGAIALFIIGYINAEQWMQTYSYGNGISLLLIYGMGGTAILAIIYWTAIDYILNHKINLE